MGGGLFELAREGGHLMADGPFDGADALLAKPGGDVGDGLTALLANGGTR